MTMLNWANNLVLGVADLLLGWLLHLPRDIALVVLALLTSLVLTFVRKWTTDQDLLRRCAADKKRLKALIRDAKRSGDKDALRRRRATSGMIAMKAFHAERRPLLWSILPIAILAVWGMARVDYHPPRAGEEIEIVCTFPLSACGEPAIMVPMDGVQAIGGWIREIVPQENQAPSGEARWTILAGAAAEPYELTIRQGKQTFIKGLLVGQPVYSPTLRTYGNDGVPSCVTELRRYRPFRVVPGLATWLPPWLAGYLLLALAFVFGLRKALNIR